MTSQIICSAIYARTADHSNQPAPAYRTSCVVELPFTLVSGSRTFVALDSEGVVMSTGILEPGGDMGRLVADLEGLRQLLDTGPARPTLQLVQ